jgi:hypothetical protein
LEEEELWISIYRTPWTTPPDFRPSWEWDSVELKTGVGSKWLRAMRSFARQSRGTRIKLLPPSRTMSAVRTIASNRAGGWVHDIPPNVFFWVAIYIDI